MSSVFGLFSQLGLRGGNPAHLRQIGHGTVHCAGDTTLSNIGVHAERYIGEGAGTRQGGKNMQLYVLALLCSLLLGGVQRATAGPFTIGLTCWGGNNPVFGGGMMQRWVCRTWAYAAALAVVMLVAPCGTAAGQAFAGREKLRAHSNEFRKEVIRVTDGVYVAVGYSAANVILIQGNNGSIIVDTASDPVEAREVRAAFGNLLIAPVRAIIYTHGH